MSVTPLQVPARPSFRDFFLGFSLPFRAVGYIRRTPKLRLLAIVSGVVTLLSLGLVAWAALRGTPAFVDWALFPYEEARWGRIAWWLLAAAAFFLTLVVGAQTVPLLALAPLQDVMSEATEALWQADAGQKFSVGAFARGLWVSLQHNLTRLALLYGGHLVLLTVLLVPGVGGPIWTVLATTWTVVWMSVEYFGAAMVRHFYPFRAVVAVFRRRPLLCAGFGAAVYLWLWVPVVNFFFIPVAIVGGTLLFCALRTAGVISALGNGSGPPAVTGQHVVRLP